MILQKAWVGWGHSANFCAHIALYSVFFCLMASHSIKVIVKKRCRLRGLNFPQCIILSTYNFDIFSEHYLLYAINKSVSVVSCSHLWIHIASLKLPYVKVSAIASPKIETIHSFLDFLLFYGCFKYQTYTVIRNFILSTYSMEKEYAHLCVFLHARLVHDDELMITQVLP